MCNKVNQKKNEDSSIVIRMSPMHITYYDRPSTVVLEFVCTSTCPFDQCNVVQKRVKSLIKHNQWSLCDVSIRYLRQGKENPCYAVQPRFLTSPSNSALPPKNASLSIFCGRVRTEASPKNLAARTQNRRGPPMMMRMAEVAIRR